MSVNISFTSLSDIHLSPTKLFSSHTSLPSEDSQTVMGAESQVTAQSSFDEEDAEEETSPKLVISPTATVTTVPKNPAHQSSSSEKDKSSNHPSRKLSKLEQKRLALRHQRFSLEKRLFEFGSRYNTNSNMFPKKPSRHVLEMEWRDKKTGTRVVYSGPVDEMEVPHGSGAIMKFSDGQVYQGDVYCGARNGQGTNSWPDGQEYCGEWKNNHRNGKGRHAWAGPRDKRKIVTGEWKDGNLHGTVRFSWPNGASYEGTCYDGKRHGRGVHTWGGKDVGKVYNGNYEKGKEHGFGTLTLPDGVTYRGQWRYGKKEGYGVMLWKTRTYDGEWKNNKPHGQGRVVWYNGAEYTGHIENGLYHGVGVYIWPSGKRFVGRWEHGVKAASGFYSWPDGKKYDGEYKNGKKHGFGEYTSSDGMCYRGEWQQNKRHGNGVLKAPDGEVLYAGIWHSDEPIELYSSAEASEKKNKPLCDKENMTAKTNMNGRSEQVSNGKLTFSSDQNVTPKAAMGKHLLDDDDSIESDLLCSSVPRDFFRAPDVAKLSTIAVTPSPRAK
eukprot:scaffold3857_cov127-Cylindrotheca_fusiformis.AAC.10